MQHPRQVQPAAIIRRVQTQTTFQQLLRSLKIAKLVHLVAQPEKSGRVFRVEFQRLLEVGDACFPVRRLRVVDHHAFHGVCQRQLRIQSKRTFDRRLAFSGHRSVFTDEG